MYRLGEKAGHPGVSPKPVAAVLVFCYCYFLFTSPWLKEHVFNHPPPPVADSGRVGGSRRLVGGEVVGVAKSLNCERTSCLAEEEDHPPCEILPPPSILLMLGSP